MFKINQVLCPGRVSHFLGTSWQFSSISMGEGRKKSLKKSDYKKEIVQNYKKEINYVISDGFKYKSVGVKYTCQTRTTQSQIGKILFRLVWDWMIITI